MSGLGIAVLLGVVLFAGGAIAWRTRLPSPLVLLVLGIGLGWLPGAGTIQLPPEVVLSLFLPALLYWEALQVSTRELRRNLRVVLLSAIPLVLATAAAVAGAGAAAGLTLPVAIALGAVVAPTDATAVGPVASRLPRRVATVLRSESLINDGTALTLLAVAVTAVEHRRDVDLAAGGLQFIGAYAGGIAIGVATAVLARLARRLVRGQPLLENTVSVLTPFVAFLPSQALPVSGVIAVVTCGLILTHYGPRMMSARTRAQARGFWQLASGLVNGVLFLLVGLQAHRVLDRLDGDRWRTVGFGVLIALLVIAVRLVWVNTTPYVIRAIDRRPAQRLRRVGVRQRVVAGWAGMRGAVSLAAALSLPESFPGRDALIAVTLTVIVVTLLLQGLTMPAVVRFARLPVDPTERQEEALAERTMRDAGAASLDRIAERLGTPEEVTALVRQQYEERSRRIADAGDASPWATGSEGELRRALIAKKREAVIRLRDAGDIDDTILTRMQDRLDIEELRLSPVVTDG